MERSPRGVPVPVPSAREGNWCLGQEGPQCRCGHTLPPAATLGSQGVTEEEEIRPLLQEDISVPSPVTSPGCWPSTCTSLPSLHWAELSSRGLCSDTAELAPAPAPERRDGGSHVVSPVLPGAGGAQRVRGRWDVSGRFPPSWALIPFPVSRGAWKGPDSPSTFAFDTSGVARPRPLQPRQRCQIPEALPGQGFLFC